ncbi:MAG: right-handed parallel beta-helix repeat-containing protein [Sedimentisphaerales bacterium]|nr:right-handed parallel beta-helix repeat-containing protein [Sedimentisphaerales bacterium]
MKTSSKVYLILLSLCLCTTAFAASPTWIYGIAGPSQWTIDPLNPEETDTISFSGPIGGVYSNSCVARANLGGTPMISIDNINKVVELWFQGPAPTTCTYIWQPVCGLEGVFGPLTTGNWTFKSTVPEIAFEITFTVGSPVTNQVYYVDPDAPGPFHNGTSWKWAFRNLQDALAVAVAGDTILVAEGIYKPDKGDLVTTGDREASFRLTDDVTVIGSHAGYGHVDPEARDFDTYTSVLSGDLNGDDSWGAGNRDDNSYHVVTAADCNSCSMVLDGFVITGGQADGTMPHSVGAGIYIDGTNPILKNCTISGNEAVLGGGVSSRNEGSAVLLNCKIVGNSAWISGGGLYCYSNNMDMTNCLIAGNSTSYAEYIGGSAIYNLGGSLTMTNCTVADNLAPNGMAILSYALEFPADNSLSVNNSILYNGGDEILTNHPETSSVYYTDIKGGWTGTGLGNINSDPDFVSPGVWTLVDGYVEGDLRIQPGSPCQNKGSNSLLPNDEGDLDEDGNTGEQLPVDLDGEARVDDSKVDMGAYEQQGTVTPEDPNWQHLYTIFITHTKTAENPSATLSNTVTLTLPIPTQGNLKPEVYPVSAAGGTWTAWFDPDPGVVGPGSVSLTIYIRGTNVDLTQFPSGPSQHIANLEIYINPIP